MTVSQQALCTLGLVLVCTPTEAHPGPQAARLDRAWERESGRFQSDYNDRLLGGLVGLSLLDILVFRFLMRVAVLETLGWLAFAFLQVSGCLGLLSLPSGA